MYSNERGSRFSILDLIIKIIFAALFILILVWLFPKVPNMTAFYSNVFRENISYMQDAGESYFTDDKMPESIGQEVKITLAELFSKKLVLPFVDKDGNSCNQYDSYVSIIKQEDESYTLKTNLVCNTESDYLIKILGCHTYCKDESCNKKCSIEQITMYQYKKSVTSTITKYSCASGYVRDGKYCYKSGEDSVEQLTVVKTENNDTTKKVTDTVLVNTTASSTKTEEYACQKETCETKTKPTYSCNCSSYLGPTGKLITTCDVCGGGTYESCSTYTTTCTRQVTVPGTTTYKCPSQSTNYSGTGSSLACWHFNTVDGGYSYSCPSGTDTQTGSGESLKCYNVIEGSTEKIKASVTKNKKTYYKYQWSKKTSIWGWNKTGKTKTVQGEEVCE